MSVSYFRISSLIVLSGLFWSCGKNENQVKFYALVSSGEFIGLPLDDSTSNVSMGLEYYQGQKPWLFSSNPISNSLQMYDLESQKLEKEIFFEKEGDQPVVLGHFHVHNPDSIFIFPEWKMEFFLSNTAGEIKKRYRFELPTDYTLLFVHNSYFVSTPQIHGKELVARIRGNFNVTELTGEELAQKSLLAAINLETGETRILPQNFPQDYLAQGLKQMEFSVAPWGEGVAVSFMGDHRIYFAESIEGAMQSKSAASKYLDANLPTFEKEGGSKAYIQYFFTMSKYESLIFDSYRQVYYRLAFPTIQVETDEELRALRSSPGPFVVMVLDQDFNVLTETKFEAGRYLPSNFFVGEKGLYLSTSHSDNPQIKEDTMGFELIELKEIR